MLLKLETAREALDAGEVIAAPTSSSFALCVDPRHGSAAQLVFALKRRTPDAPLLVLVGSVGDAESALGRAFSRKEAELVRRYWPGPLTLVLEGGAGLLPLCRSNDGYVALRWDTNPTLQALLSDGRTVTGTSANLSGTPPLFSAEDVVEQFAGGAGFGGVYGGLCGGNVPSTLLKVEPCGRETILRPGPLADTLSRNA